MPNMEESRATERPLRSDARRNRDKVLAAASAAYAERGLDAPLDEIARRAGVSIGTLYNRFASRDALVDAVFCERIERYVELGDRALDEADPWTAFTTYVVGVCELQASDRGLNDLLSGHPLTLPRVDGVTACGHDRARRLIERAQGAGVLRADFRPEDLPLVIWSTARIVERAETVAPGAWRRHLGFVLDGLRAEAASENPREPLRPEEVLAAATGRASGSSAG